MAAHALTDLTTPTLREGGGCLYLTLLVYSCQAIAMTTTQIAERRQAAENLVTIAIDTAHTHRYSYSAMVCDQYSSAARHALSVFDQLPSDVCVELFAASEAFRTEVDPEVKATLKPRFTAAKASGAAALMTVWGF